MLIARGVSPTFTLFNPVDYKEGCMDKVKCGLPVFDVKVKHFKISTEPMETSPNFP